MGTQTTIVEKESSRKKIWVRKDLFTSQETSEEVVTPSRPGPASKTGRPPYHGEVNSTNWEQHLISDNEDKEELVDLTEEEYRDALITLILAETFNPFVKETLADWKKA